MLHIILLILKIIGIILLCILGIILLILLSVLVIPIRYKIDFSIYEYGSIRCIVSWFLRIFSVNFNYEKGEFDKYVRIFGIRTKLLFGKKEEKDDFDYNNSEEKDIFEEINESFSEKKHDYKDMYRPEKDDIIELFKDEEQESFNQFHEEDISQVNNEHLEEEDTSSNVKKKSIFNKIWDKLKKIRFKIKSIYGKIKKIYKKAASIKEFFELEQTKEAISFLKKQAGTLFKYIKPRKITGRLKFGTGSPASTGEILGIIYIFYKGANEKFIIEPDFDNKVLEGEIHLKGRITVFSMLIIALKLYRNKNLKNTIKNGKKLKEE